MEKKKLVKRDYFNAWMDFVKSTGFSTDTISNGEMVAFCEKELELLAKKNVANRKPTAKDKETEALRAELVAILTEADEPMTISDIIKNHSAFAGFTPQRITGLLNPLVDVVVERIKVKGRSYYKMK